MTIFSDLIENSWIIFGFGSSCENFLHNVSLMLYGYSTTNLVPISKKCLFIVKDLNIITHKVSSKGNEVDTTKVEVITTLSPLSSVRGSIVSKAMLTLCYARHYLWDNPYLFKVYGIVD